MCNIRHSHTFGCVSKYRKNQTKAQTKQPQQRRVQTRTHQRAHQTSVAFRPFKTAASTMRKTSATCQTKRVPYKNSPSRNGYHIFSVFSDRCVACYSSEIVLALLRNFIARLHDPYLTDNFIGNRYNCHYNYLSILTALIISLQ